MLLDKLIQGKPLPSETLKENEAKWKYWEESYEGDSEYLDGKDDRGNDILTPFDCERKSDYKKRKEITPIKNYTKPIVEKYNSAVFRNAPVRVDFPDVIYNDADGLGSNYDEMMQQALRYAQIYGVSYLMPMRTYLGEVLTIAQAQSANTRTFVRLLEPESVSEIEEIDGVIIEAIVVLSDEDGRTFARYMNNTDYIDIQLDNGGRIASVGEAYPHGYSKIPLVAVKPDLSSESQVAPIANSQRHITNLNSLLIHELVEQNFTRWMLSGVDPENIDGGIDAIQAMWSTKRLMVIKDAAAATTRLGSDTTQAESTRKSIEAELSEMYRNAGLSASNVDLTSTVASGVSLLVNREDFFLICSKLMKAIQVADNKLMQLISEVDGFVYTPSVYSSQFMASDESEAITKLRDILALDVPQTIKNMMIKKYVETFYDLDQNQMAEIEREMNESA